jgi:hypothetical protein
MNTYPDEEVPASAKCYLLLSDETLVSVLHDEPAFSEIFVSYLLSRTIRI